MAIHKLEAALDRVARELLTEEDLQRASRVERAIDAQGNPRLEGRDFIPLLSPDGKVWRIRVDNSGNVYASPVTPS